MASKNVKSANTKRVVKKEDKKINPKNYIYAVLILVGGILLVLYFFKWYDVKQEEKYMTSYLISSKTIESSITELSSLSQIRQEAPSNYFIYFGYTKDEDVYKLEKDLKKVIDKYNINDIFYYFDLTNMMEKDDNYLDKVKENLGISDLDRVPAVIYVKNGQIEKANILDGVKDTKFKAYDLESLLDIYDFETVK